jgi:hypothetical protein
MEDQDKAAALQRMCERVGEQLTRATAVRASSDVTHEVVSDVDPKTLAIQEELAHVQRLGKQTVEHILKVGKLLNEKHASMGVNRDRGVPSKGEWSMYLRDKLSLELRTAQRFMQAARTFAPEPKIVEHLDLSAAYVLSRPTTPPEALEAATNRIKRGNPVTHAKAMELVRKHTPAKPYKPKHKTSATFDASRTDAAPLGIADLLDKLDRLVNVPRLQLSPIEIRDVVGQIRAELEQGK